MHFLNSSEPLGLPRGSVRALITLLITGVFCIRFAAGLPVDATLSFALGAVLNYYFIKRDGATGPVDEIPPEPES